MANLLIDQRDFLALENAQLAARIDQFSQLSDTYRLQAAKLDTANLFLKKALSQQTSIVTVANKRVDLLERQVKWRNFAIGAEAVIVLSLFIKILLL